MRFAWDILFFLPLSAYLTGAALPPGLFPRVVCVGGVNFSRRHPRGPAIFATSSAVGGRDKLCLATNSVIIFYEEIF